MTRSTLAALVVALSATIATPGYSQELRGQDSLTTSWAGTAGLRGRTYSFAFQPRAATYTPLRDSLNAARIGAGLAPIPYADLPTGGGTWANGGNLSITGGALTVGSVIVNHGSTAKVTIDGTDGTVASGSDGIVESAGNLQLSSRSAMQFQIDNDNTETTTFGWGHHGNYGDLMTLSETGLLSPAGGISTTTGAFSGDITITSDDIVVGSGVTTGNVDARMTVNAGTNAGTNTKDSHVEFQRAGTALWRTGVLGSVATNGAFRLYDPVNSASIVTAVPSSSNWGITVASNSTTGAVDGFVAVNSGTASGANNRDSYFNIQRGQTSLWKMGVLGTVAANANWTLRDAANSVNTLVIAPSTGNATFLGSLTSATGIIGTDPGGTDKLRVGGGATFTSEVEVQGNEFRSLTSGVDLRVGSGAFGASSAIGTVSNHALSFYTNSSARGSFAADGSLVVGSDPGGSDLVRVGGTSRFVSGNGVQRASQVDLGRFSDAGNVPLFSLQTADADTDFGEDALFLYGQRWGSRVWFVRNGATGDRAYARLESGFANNAGRFQLYDGSALTGGNGRVFMDGADGTTILGVDPGGSELLRVGGNVRFGSMAQTTNVDGQPTFAQTDSLKQLSMGDSPKGGYILLNGLNYGADKGDVLITGNARSSGTGDIKIRKWNGSSADTNAVFRGNGTLEVGSPTGGTSGVGKINVSVDVYRNDDPYDNSDYVFDAAYGSPSPHPAPEGYRIPSLGEVEQFTKEHHYLPGISREPSGMFERADMLLAKVEELYLHAFDLDRRIKALEEENQSPKTRVQELSKDAPK